ncbi:hypothetical protein JB92DRAFT_2977288 [Gautieria morchelliformis]|nr:hypothetical protein JB92DRAFT_2977288 [Gautieria morchelliformis]
MYIIIIFSFLGCSFYGVLFSVAPVQVVPIIVFHVLWFSGCFILVLADPPCWPCVVCLFLGQSDYVVLLRL